MENEFKVGDRVRIAVDELHGYKIIFEKGDAGVVTGIAENGYVGVSFDGPLAGCAFMDCKYLEADKAYDPKTAFLSELKGLLERYGAELGDSGMYEIEGMEVTFGNGDRISYKHSTINALNIMDYEKE